MKRPTINLIPALAALLCLAGGARAQLGSSYGQQQSADDLVSVEAAADTTAIAPGQTFHLAFIFEMEPHWHIYWINPGASGAPTSIEVKAPDGYEVGETMFTRPAPIGSWDDPAGLTYGYEDKAVLFVPVTAPKRLGQGEAIFSADIMFLVCKGKCLMGTVKRTVVLPTTSERGAPSAGGAGTLIDEAKQQLPRPLKDLPGAKLTFKGETVTITAPAGDFTNATLFPIESPGVTFGRPEVTIENGTLTARVEVEVRPQNARGEPLKIAGVLGLGTKRSDPSYAFEIPLSES